MKSQFNITDVVISVAISKKKTVGDLLEYITNPHQYFENGLD